MFERFKNKIVTIEGGDGTGKDTIINILYKKLPSSFVVRFPDRSNSTGKVIDKILRKEIPFPDPLAFQSLMLTNKIETLLDIERNTNINPEIFLFCRYYESAYVYGLNDGIPVNLSYTLNSVLPKSEMTFILDGKKYRADNEHYEQSEIQDNLSKNYRILARKFGWNIINNEKTPEEISNEIIEKLQFHMNNKFDHTLD